MHHAQNLLSSVLLTQAKEHESAQKHRECHTYLFINQSIYLFIIINLSIQPGRRQYSCALQPALELCHAVSFNVFQVDFGSRNVVIFKFTQTKVLVFCPTSGTLRIPHIIPVTSSLINAIEEKHTFTLINYVNLHLKLLVMYQQS